MPITKQSAPDIAAAIRAQIRRLPHGAGLDRAYNAVIGVMLIADPIVAAAMIELYNEVTTPASPAPTTTTGEKS